MPILGHENPIYYCIQSQIALTDQSSVREPSLLFDPEGHFRTASSSCAPNSLGRNQKDGWLKATVTRNISKSTVA